jgi:hypothetical protein
VTSIDCPDRDRKGNRVLLCDAEFETSAGSSVSRVLPSTNHLSTPRPTRALGSCPVRTDIDLEVGILDLHLRDDRSMVVGSISSRYVVDEVVGVTKSWSSRF